MRQMRTEPLKYQIVCDGDTNASVIYAPLFYETIITGYFVILLDKNIKMSKIDNADMLRDTKLLHYGRSLISFYCRNGDVDFGKSK